MRSVTLRCAFQDTGLNNPLPVFGEGRVRGLAMIYLGAVRQYRRQQAIHRRFIEGGPLTLPSLQKGERVPGKVYTLFR
jgi:hypothetical protein